MRRTTCALGVASIMATGGCASGLQAVFPPDDGARLLTVAYEPVGEGMRIRLLVAAGQPAGRPDGKDWLGWGTDVAVGALVPWQFLTFNDFASAMTVAALGSAVVLGGDLLLGMGLSAGRSGGGPRMPWLARVAYSPAGIDLPVALSPGAIGLNGQEFSGVAALPAGLRTVPFTVSIRNPRGAEIRSEIAQLPGTAVAGGAYAPQGTSYAAQPNLPVDVDDFPGQLKAPDPNAAAVVIGLERYNARIPGVPYAERDAAVVAGYLVRVLGVRPENILVLANEQATKGAIETAIEEQLPGLVTAGQSDVYVFYAGHGAPDLDTKVPYLIPYDGNPDFPKKSCYSLSQMYAALGKLRARSVTVMLDACFTGTASRADRAVGLIANARPLFVSPVASALPRGVSVIAAASGDQVSSGLASQRHGLFTYYLLKGMRGEAFAAGRLTLGGLQAYLAREVPGQARRLGRVQTPVLLGGNAERVLVER